MAGSYPMKGSLFLHHASGELFVARGPASSAMILVYRQAAGPTGRTWSLTRTSAGSWRDEDGHGYQHVK